MKGATLKTMEDENAMKMKQLELGWNNKIRIEKESRRILTMGEDIREFLNNSMSMTPNPGGFSPERGGFNTTGGFGDSPDKEARMTQNSLSPMRDTDGNMVHDAGNTIMHHHQSPDGTMRMSSNFDVIASTFNFQHHEGTDEQIELKIIKCIVMRESMLMKLKHFVDVVEQRNPYGEITLKPAAGAKIIELMMSVRNTTLDYLDNLHRWRLSDRNNDATVDGDNPKVFVWEGYNYTMKIVSDMDFLGEKEALVAALNQTPEKMRANPLMLPTTLEETADTWVDPAMRAAMDANNATSGEYFESRLRLRNAERLLLLEIEVNANFIPPQLQELSHASEHSGVQGGMALHDTMSDDKLSKMLSWRQEATEQMMYLDPKNPSNNGGNHYQQQQQAKGDRSDKKKGGHEPHQQQQQPWDQQAEIFPEVDVDSGANFYQEFVPDSMNNDKNGSGSGGNVNGDALGGNGDNSGMHTGELGRYDQFLQGDDILAKGMNEEQNNEYDAMFGVVPSSTVFVGGIVNDELGGGLNTDSKITLSSTLSIEALSAYDVDVLANLPRPPRSVILAGAICVILLSPGDQLPGEVSWEAFRKLAFQANTVNALNTLDPQSLPAFKTRAVAPFLERLTLDEERGTTRGGGVSPLKGDGTSGGLTDALGSVTSHSSVGNDVPLEAGESVDKLFRYVKQVITATTGGKKRRQKKGSTVLPPMMNSDGHSATVGAGGVAKVAGKHKQQPEKKATQSEAASRMMVGKTSAPKVRKPKKLDSIDTMWPVRILFYFLLSFLVWRDVSFISFDLLLSVCIL
jgi:hypothetical protein